MTDIKVTKQELVKRLRGITLTGIERTILAKPRHGEASYYFELNQDVAKELEKSSLPEKTTFIADDRGRYIRLLLENGNEVDMLSIGRDTFSYGGECGMYCRESLSSFREKLRLSEIFLVP